MSTRAGMTSTAQAAPPERRDLLELRHDELSQALSELLKSLREPSYRSGQLRDWIYRRTPSSFAEMDNVPRRLRQHLEAGFTLHPLEKSLEKVSADATRKFLWKRRDGSAIESVLIPDGDRTTYCVSTQVGCPVKCTFCATGYGGFAGQLSASEIIDQTLRMRQLSGSPPTNLVYMGMGEPLLNFQAVVRSLEILIHREQMGFGARRITVSTVGVPERIRELGRLFPQVKLAISLHAPRDDLRNELIPLNRTYPLKAVLGAAGDHARRTGKKVTFEYIVLPGVNDSQRESKQLCQLVRGIPSRINLIGFNPFPEAPYGKPAVHRLLQFRSWIEEHHDGPVTIRRSRGEDIQGACGQLSLTNR